MAVIRILSSMREGKPAILEQHRNYQDVDVLCFALDSSDMNSHTGLIMYPHWHRYPEVLLCARGEVTILLDGRPEPVRAGEALFIQSDQLHAGELTKARDSLVYPMVLLPRFQGRLRAQNQLAARLYEPGQLIPPRIRDETALRYLKDAISMADSEESESVAFLLLMSLALECFAQSVRIRSDVHTQSSLTHSKVREMLKYVDDHMSRELTPAALAREYHISAGTLYRLFRQYTGQSPSQYIIRSRLERSMAFLKNTEMSAEEIAKRSGFSSANYYIRCFKAAYRITPHQFRLRR